jgi:hypothetical protein
LRELLKGMRSNGFAKLHRVGDSTFLKKSNRMSIQQCSTGHRKDHDSSSHNDNMAHKECAPRMYSINRFSCFERSRDDDVATHVTRRALVFTLVDDGAGTKKPLYS